MLIKDSELVKIERVYTPSVQDWGDTDALCLCAKIVLTASDFEVAVVAPAGSVGVSHNPELLTILFHSVAYDQS